MPWLVLALVGAACNAIVGIEDPNIVEPKGCIASDCPNENDVCLFKTCSPPCSLDRDCSDGQRCLATDLGKGCVGARQATCTSDGQCPTGSGCFDGECRSDCRSNASLCLDDQVCASDGSCRGTEPATGGKSSGGAGGRSGAGQGGSSSGGSSARGGATADGGSAGEGAGRGGTDGSGGTLGQGAEAGDPGNIGGNAGDADGGTGMSSGKGGKGGNGGTGGTNGGTGGTNGGTGGSNGGTGGTNGGTGGTGGTDAGTGGSNGGTGGTNGGTAGTGGSNGGTGGSPLKSNGESCSSGSECTSTNCVDDYCCTSTCTAACQACDRPGLEGVCGSIDFSGDIQNCGACGDACSSNHVTGLGCNGGVCSGACSGTWANCDNDLRTNGCEIDKSTNISHCGGCNMACSASHVTGGSCSGGNCAGTCQGSWLNCDGNLRTNGCEIDGAGDPLNCGNCNVVCKYGFCQSTSCAFSRWGNYGPGTSSENRGGNVAQGMRIVINSATTVKALGVRSGAILGTPHIRLALYLENGSGAPQNLIVQTPEMSAVANDVSEALVSATAISAGTYWLFIVTDATLRLATEEPSTSSWWRATMTYGAFGALPALTSQTFNNGDLYVVTTP